MGSLTEKADMVMGYNIGEMGDMRDTGKTIRRAAKESFSMLKVTSIVGNGFMTSCMGKEFIFLVMVPHTKVNGQIIIRMATVKRLQLMVHTIQANSVMERNTEKATKYSLTIQSI